MERTNECIDLYDILASKLSGTIKYKNTKEMWLEDKSGEQITIELIDIIGKKYTVRHYYKNGNKKAEYNYIDDMEHGQFTIWYENGNKCWEYHYKNGKLDGKYSEWHEDGKIHWTYNYVDGKLKPMV